MNTKATIEHSGNGQQEESNYSPYATLEHYEVEEISAPQMAKWLHEIRQNAAATIVSASV